MVPKPVDKQRSKQCPSSNYSVIASQEVMADARNTQAYLHRTFIQNISCTNRRCLVLTAMPCQIIYILARHSACVRPMQSVHQPYNWPFGKQGLEQGRSWKGHETSGITNPPEKSQWDVPLLQTQDAQLTPIQAMPSFLPGAAARFMPRRYCSEAWWALTKALVSFVQVDAHVRLRAQLQAWFCEFL